MAKIFGPYSQYAISEDGRFFGFNENDDNLLRYKMSDDVVQAIQESFSLIRDDTSPILVTKYWPADAQPTIEFYNEIFRNAEVIPYVYYLEEQYIADAATNGIPQNFVPCSSFVVSNAPVFGESTKTAYSAGFDNNGDVLAYSSFNSTDTIYQSQYLWGGSLNADILKRCKLATKEEHENIVLKPDIFSIDSLVEGNVRLEWKNYRTLGSLFNTSGSIIDPFDVDSVYNTSDFKTKFAGLKFIKSFDTYDNSADGAYSESNKRERAGTLWDGNLTGRTYPWHPNLGQSQKGKNSFVFFVKTFAPWYNSDGTVDDTRENVQYWCFNIATLFAQRFYNNAYSFNWSMANIYSESFNNFEPRTFRDGSFVGLGIQAKTSTGEGPTPQNFFIPFAWNVLKTRYFTNSVVVGDYAPAGVDWENEVATQNGTSLGFYDSNEMLNFLVNGLGLPATLDDDELLFKSVEEWERDFPTGDVPGAGGQIGGLTGGGQGSGIGETFDNVGNPSASTRGTYTQSSYILNELNMKHLQEAMVNDSLWATITNMFKNNPQDGVINLIRFPINFDNLVTINNEDVTILGVNIAEMGETGYVRGTKIPNEIRTAFDLGSFDFPERFGTFLDFEPYTKTTLFLPFIGFKQISTDAIVGRRVRIHYDVDYSDGSCVCVVRVSNARTTGVDFSSIERLGFTPLYTFDGQIGQIIPLTQNNAQEKNQSIIKNSLTTLGSVGLGLATGGAAGAAVAGVSSAVMNAAGTLMDKTRHNTSGTISSQQAYAINDLTPFVIIDFPEINLPNGFQQYSGYITNLYQRMNSVRGFTQFDNVRVTGINCTADEETELKNLLESGVIINE